MTELTFARPLRRRRGPYVLVAVVLFAGAAAGTLFARTLLYRGETMPGVRVLGVGVGGEARPALERRIRAIVGARLARPMTVLVGRRRLTVRPERLLEVNAGATAAAALAAGQSSFAPRAATLLTPAPPRREVEPVLQIRRAKAGAFLADLRRFGRPPVDAKVALVGLRPVVRPARPGTVPRGHDLLESIRAAVLSGDPVVRASFRRVPATIPTRAAKVAAAQASMFVSAPIELRRRGDAVGRLEPQEVARALRFRRVDAGYAARFDEALLAQTLAPAVARWKRDPVDAAFVVEGDRVRVIPAKQGWTLDAVRSVAAVFDAARGTTVRSAELALRPVEPALTTREAYALGIRQRISSFTTEMGPSSANRIHNVHLMADYIDGTIVRPGETFSFNRVVGPRTEARGFRQGQMIFGSLLVPSVGGGVCQTATTLFNNAFALGLPIVERHNHSWYISHYPLGRDATVSWGGPDFIFENDLEHAILIKSSYSDATLTFTFYGTPQGRRVVATTGPRTNWRRARTSYALDPAAPPGSVRIVRGSNQAGFDVTVFRTVHEHGQVVRRDALTSSYVAVGPTAIHGPGRPIPGPYFVLPTT